MILWRTKASFQDCHAEPDGPESVASPPTPHPVRHCHLRDMYGVMTTAGGEKGDRPVSVPVITLMLFSSDSQRASPACDPLSCTHIKSATNRRYRFVWERVSPVAPAHKRHVFIQPPPYCIQVRVPPHTPAPAELHSSHQFF